MRRNAIAILALSCAGTLLASGCASLLGDFTSGGDLTDGGGNDSSEDARSPLGDATIDGPVSPMDDAGPEASSDAPVGPIDGGVDAADATPPCSNACVAGESQCVVTANGSVVQRCEAQATACTAWVDATTCASSQSCSVGGDGGAACTCASTLCTVNGPVCENQSTLATCATDPTTSCIYVSSTTSCTTPNPVCGGNAGKAACAPTCTDSCTSGSKTCANGEVVTCATQSSTCLAYGTTGTACASNQTCSVNGASASCVCDNPAACDGVTGNTCTQGGSYVDCAADANGCLVATTESCDPHATCSGTGLATTPCKCNLGYSGSGTSCTPTGCVITGKYYPNGTVNSANACQVCNIALNLTDWSNEADGTSCGPSGAGETCTNAKCGCPSTAPNLCGVECVSDACGAVTACSGAASSAAANELALDGSTAYWVGGDTLYSCATNATNGTAATYVSFPKVGKLLFSYYVTSVAWNGLGGLYYGERQNTQDVATLYADPSPSTSSKNETVTDTSAVWGGLLATDTTTRALFLLESTGVFREVVSGTDPDGGFPDYPCLTETTPALVSAGGGYVVSYDSGASDIVGTGNTGSGCGKQSTLATGSYVGAVTAITNDGGAFAFANATGVYLCPTSGCGAAPTPIATSQGAVNGLAMDPSFVYWVGTSGLVACSRSGCGGTPTVIVPGATPTFGIALDATHVYYVDDTGANTTGNIYRSPK